MNIYMEKAFGLNDKVALITGGGSGLGFAMSTSLSAAGAKVIIVGRHEQTLKEACKKIGENAVYYIYDVTKNGAAQELIKKITDKFGKIDILINNAGCHCKKPVESVSQEDFQQVLDVHILGGFELIKAVLPYMRKQKSGSIVMISSMSAYLGMTQVVAYSAAKSAVLGMVKSISGEVSCDGIRVNAIVPGFIDTPMFRKATDGDVPRQQKILGHTPMKAYGESADIGWAAVYLCSNAAKFVTGTTLVVDGGCSIGF